MEYHLPIQPTQLPTCSLVTSVPCALSLWMCKVYVTSGRTWDGGRNTHNCITSYKVEQLITSLHNLLQEYISSYPSRCLVICTHRSHRHCVFVSFSLISVERSLDGETPVSNVSAHKHCTTLHGARRRWRIEIQQCTAPPMSQRRAVGRQSRLVTRGMFHGRQYGRGRASEVFVASEELDA